MAADHGASGLDHLREAAGENALEGRDVGFVGEANERQRSQRLTTHGVDVAERVGGGDLAEDVGIVDDGSEEVDRLDERRLRRELIHAGIVGMIEADQNVRVVLPG